MSYPAERYYGDPERGVVYASSSQPYLLDQQPRRRFNKDYSLWLLFGIPACCCLCIFILIIIFVFFLYNGFGGYGYGGYGGGYGGYNNGYRRGGWFGSGW